jgi:hypothetical protein
MTEVLKSAAEEIAARMDRKRFVRTLSSKLFAGFAIVSAGGGVQLLRASVASAVYSACETPTGAGCPTGCGPSQCCFYSGRSASCQCGSGTNCANNGDHCHGYAGTWGGTACWTCYGSWYTCLGCQCRSYTTCCDCATSGCGDSSGHCISWYSGTQKACPPRVAGAAPTITNTVTARG